MYIQQGQIIGVMAKPSPNYAGTTVLVDLGQRIRAVREKQGLSQESVALASGIDRSYFGGIERGEHMLRLLTLKR